MDSKITRRKALQSLVTAAGATFAAPMLNFGRFQLFGGTAEYSTRTIDLLGRSLVIDMLAPISLNMKTLQSWLNTPETYTEKDHARFLESKIDVFHVAFGIGGPEAYNRTFQFISGLNNFLANHDQLYMRIDSAADFERQHRTGKPALLLGVQNAEHFRKLDDVNSFHNMGQRVSQLTYNARNMIGNGSTERIDGGISDFGARIIGRMDKVGMAVDVSHCGDQTTLDAFEISKKPVLITHSNCRALAPGHPRCKTDEAIKKMAATGGVMGVTSVRMFVKNDEPTTIEHYLDHFDHVAKLVGAEHLGVGSDIDLDGYDDLPAQVNQQLRANYKQGDYRFRDKIDIEGVDHPKRMFDLTEGLIRRDYSDGDIEGILGGNFKRALVEIWK